jgi:hypothetical protein
MGPRPFQPKNSATGEDRRALGRIGNIQNKLLKALYRKGSPKNSSTSGHALRAFSNGLKRDKKWYTESKPCNFN